MDRGTHPNDVTPRRGFFTRVAASAMAIGLTGLGPVAARAEAGAEDGPDWPGTLKGRHRQVVDAYAPNDGFPLAFCLYVRGDKRASERRRRPGECGGGPAPHGLPARARPPDVGEIQDRPVAQHS